MYCIVCASYLFFFTATSTTEIYTLSLHDALPILAGGVDRVDTLVVVAGSTKPLPSGGTVADALYHSRTDRLYMTNIQRNRSEEHTSELQSRLHLVCRLLLEKKKKQKYTSPSHSPF